jgi:hypothetical protein
MFLFENGLLTAIRTSTTTMARAEQQMLDFVRTHTDAGTCPLAGNSVSEDRRFLRKCMPRLAEHLHYRTVDVSTIKELAKYTFPTIKTSPPSLLFTDAGSPISRRPLLPRRNLIVPWTTSARASPSYSTTERAYSSNKMQTVVWKSLFIAWPYLTSRLRRQTWMIRFVLFLC